LLRALSVAAAPLRWLMEKVTVRFEALLRPRGRTLSEEEFDTVVDISGEEGIINAEELGMVKAVIRLDSMSVSDVMTPRVDLAGIDLNDLLADRLKIAGSAKVNFLLLFRDNLDNVENLLDVRKFLLDPQHRLEGSLVSPMYVPETCPLSHLLTQFQKEHRRIAVVVDQYGGTAGLITRGDIIEEISGEIYEEMSKPRPLFQQAGPHRWLVDAGFSVEELNHKLRLRLDPGDGNRLSGWIAAQAGHLPQANEVVEAQGCRVTVLQIKRQRVTLAQIEKLEIPS
jgi:putative hemolysin